MAPGTCIEFGVIDPGGGQITPDSTPGDVAALDFERVNPVTGPIFIEGAEPGDAIKVTLLEIVPSGWGWTAILPEFGLLADQFPDPHLRLWTYDRAARAPLAYGDWARVPLKPLAGSIGLAPAAPGAHDILPPRRVGGTMDIRDLGVGTELTLPVEVPGGLLSVGDGHVAQGDGEVCGTALESAIQVSARIDLLKAEPLAGPRFTTPGPVMRHLDAEGYEVTTGIGPDLMAGARDAVAGMIDHLGRTRGMPPEDAYMLCSLCADLRISEVVDQPNWVVSCYMPRLVFE